MLLPVGLRRRWERPAIVAAPGRQQTSPPQSDATGEPQHRSPGRATPQAAAVGTAAEPTIRVVRPGPDRDTYLPLLHSADNSADQVHGYYQTGTLFALDDLDGKPIGMILAIPRSDGAVELKAVAVDASLHGQGVGTRLLLEVLDQLRAGGVRRVVVGTSSSGIGQLAYYQKAGFRLSKIERDFFSPERGYPHGIEENGIPLRDMVWMDADLDDLHTADKNRSISWDHSGSSG